MAEGPALPITVCLEPGCERPAVPSLVRCRLHVADVLRREGELIPFEDPELAGLYAAAIQVPRTALAGLPQHLLEPGTPAVAVDMYALVSPDAGWQVAHFALDCLGTELSDTPPIAGMLLSAPMEFMSKILLRLQVGVPASGVGELLPRLQLALEATVREAVGAEAEVHFAVELAEASGGSSA